MIKAAIHGTTDTPNSRDLVRLLLIHPDLEFVAFVNEENVGRQLWEDVEDVYGNCNLRYTSKLELEDVDVLFCLDADKVPAEALRKLDNDENFRLIVFPPTPGVKSTLEDDDRFTMGVPEFNRKAMVRGARAVYLPPAPVMAFLCGVFPLAKCLLLPSSPVALQVHVQGPEFDSSLASEQAELVLSTIQNSFTGSVQFIASENPAHSLRGLTVDVDIPLSMDINNIREIYENTYDDHNFTFLLPQGFPLAGGDDDAPLAGCNKCFITIEQAPAGKIHIRSALDPRMKGAVGNAIHCMNLLFGLHERTGLYLKPGE